MHRWLPPTNTKTERMTRRSTGQACVAVVAFIGLLVALIAIAQPGGAALRQEILLATTSLVVALWQILRFIGRRPARVIDAAAWRGLLGNAAGAGGVCGAICYALPPGLSTEPLWLATAASIPLAAVLIVWLMLALARESVNPGHGDRLDA